jgi:ATP-dependent RNA helicase DeaD
MAKFRNREIQLLVATDVAARGIDVNDVTHVLNYNLPDEVENYTHRSGRTGRAGKTGVSLVIINTSEEYKIKQIEKVIKKEFTFKKVPKPTEITEKQLFHRIDEMVEQEVDVEGLAPYLANIYNKFDQFTKEEIIERFVANELKHLLDYYKKSKDLDAEPRSGKGGKKERGESRGEGRGRKRGGNPNAARFFVNIGKKQGLNPGGLVRQICDDTGLTKGDIGDIEILDKFAFFETDESQKDLVLSNMQNSKFDRYNMRVEETTKKKSSRSGGSGSDRRDRKDRKKGGSKPTSKDRRRNRRRR